MTHNAIHWRGQPVHGVRYTAGLTLYDEQLVGGAWQGRYWATNGFADVEETVAALAQRPDLPARAFHLTVDGQSLDEGWRLTAAFEAPQTRPSVREAVVELTHTLWPIVVRVHTQLNDGPVLVRWLEVSNQGERPVALAEVQVWSGLLMHLRGAPQLPGYERPARGRPPFSVGRFVDPAWGAEGSFAWMPLPEGTLRLDGRRGRSGRPGAFFVLRNEATGEHAVAHLGTSGSWSIALTYEEDHDRGEAWLAWSAGPAGPAPLRVLDPGETVVSPAVHLALLHGGLDDAVAAMHEHIRANVLPHATHHRASRVNYNHWSYARHELSPAVLYHEIEVAAAVGAEVFVVDAGWFGNQGTHWWDTVGDWRPGDRLPNGLEPIFERARARGLLCGLWMEPERVGPDSAVAHAHPEWLLRRGERVLDTVLDLTNEQAAGWVENEINRLVDQYGLDLFRLDYNVDIWQGGVRRHGGYDENTVWRHYEVLYGIFERLRKRRPSLILENCSSGGGRPDLGIMQYFHHTQITDWPALPRIASIVNGMTLALPPEACDHVIGVGQDGHRAGELDALLRTGLLGHLTISGVYPPGEEANPDHLERIRHHVDLYKHAIRPWLATSRLYHHTPVVAGREPHGWCVWELMSADRRHGAVVVLRLAGTAAPTYRFRPRGVAVNLTYQVTRDNERASFVKAGVDLEQQGLSINLDHALSSALLLFTAVGSDDA